jgi:hypothetical protein
MYVLYEESGSLKATTTGSSKVALLHGLFHVCTARPLGKLPMSLNSRLLHNCEQNRNLFKNKVSVQNIILILMQHLQVKALETPEKDGK